MEIEAWAFDLRPGIPPEGLPRDSVYKGGRYTPQYFEYLRDMAAEAGITMTAPSVVASTSKAHEATEFAKRAGKGLEFNHAVFQAYWERGENIGRVEVLAEAAAGCGLDAGALRQALEAGTYAHDVEEQMRWSRMAGVGGIPTFIFNEKFALVGAQTYDVFQNVAQRLLSGELKA